MSLFIREITLSGFKSFAEKTTIQLGEGLNMIVGPNGCGKSNIVDAFSWAFGESQVKNLRSMVGTDVIFAGTEKRSGSFVAKVSFSMDNKTGWLNYDAPVVKVKRQINKDNESEFFINNIPCKLKDIQQLFLDTGLGKNTYSILQQGKIDQIVVGKPEDRRILLEEAAGIRNTKILIKESQNKLDKTTDNMTRLEDILIEVKKQYDVLESQAKKALLYKQLKSDIQVSEKELLYLRLSWIQIREKSFDQDILTQQEKILKIEEQLAELEMQKPDLQEGLLIIQDNQEKLREEKNLLLITDAQINQKISLWKQEYQNIQERIQSIQQKQNIFSHLITEKNNLAENVKSKVYLLTPQKENLENLYQTLHQEQNSLNSYETELQASIKNYFEYNHTDTKEAIENLLKKLDPEREEYYAIKQKQIELVKQKKACQQKLQISLNNKQQEELLENVIYNLQQQYFLIEEQVYENNNHLLMFVEKENDLYKQYLKTLDNSEKSVKFLQAKEDIETHIAEKKDIIEQLRENISKEEKQKTSFQEESLKDKIEYEKLLQEVEFYKNSLQELEKDILDLEYKKDEYTENIDTSFEEYEKILAKREALDTQIAIYEQDYLQSQELEKQNQKEEKELRKQWNLYKDQFQELSVSTKEVEIEKKLLLEEFTTKYLYFHQEQYEIYLNENNIFHIPSQDLLELFQMAQKALQNKKMQLEQIGMVNFLAIDEFTNTQQRYNFLIKNQQDIQQSQKNLAILITDLKKQSEKAFLEVFKAVNEYLKEIFIMAFNGGTCQMKLTNSESPLEGGVEIIAQPPGKKLQNLNLLSGGEKTMVALSILFSLFMVKPAPFCLMDEVDAALDEMNVERFLRILNGFKNKVQFLIITHNRTTAQKGDIFYGVTMQEVGITKVFSFLPDNNAEIASL